MSKFVNTAAVLAAVFASQATAHTYVKEFEAGGKTYKGFYAADKSGGDDSSPAWRTNQGWGFQPVFGDKINDADIIAHIDAEPSPFTAPVPAGSDVKFTWQHDGQCGNDGDEVGWDCSHHGWTSTWLAPCNGDCANVDKTKLSFFKIHQAGLLDYPAGTRYAQGSATEDTGYWGTDDIFYKNGNSQTVTIPQDLPSGNYVLRTEVMSVHNNGAIKERQFWPQAMNIAITGGKDGAQIPEGIPATQIYSDSDPQLTFDLYQHEAGITFDAPGPAVVSIAGGSGSSSGGSGYSSGGDSSSAPAAPASSAPASYAPSAPASSAAPAVPVQSSYAAQPSPVTPSQPARVTSTYTSAVYITATATATAPAFNPSSAANYGPEPTSAPQYPDESGEGDDSDSEGEDEDASDSDDESGSDSEDDSDDEADHGEHDSYDWGNAAYNDGEPSAWGGERNWRQHARDFAA